MKGVKPKMTFLSRRDDVGGGALTIEQAAPVARDVPRLRNVLRGEMSVGPSEGCRAFGMPVFSAESGNDIVQLVEAEEMALNCSGALSRWGGGDRGRNAGRPAVVPPLRFRAES